MTVDGRPPRPCDDEGGRTAAPTAKAQPCAPHAPYSPHALCIPPAQHAGLEIRNHQAIATLASLTLAGCARYPGASGHLIRTAQVAACLAELMGLDPAEQLRIRLATPVHDLGKLAIPDHVLLKPGKLEPDEWRIMEQHTEIGAEALASSTDELLQFAAVIARHHHERFDGSGYPARLAGHAIPLAARVVAVADAFDAMTESRCYRPRMTEYDACSIIAGGSGTHFDPAAVAAFLNGFTQIRRARAAADALVDLDSDTEAVAAFYGLTPADLSLATRVATGLAQRRLRYGMGG